jgi:hypothetical protein
VQLIATYSGATVQWRKDGVNIPGATGNIYIATASGIYSCITTSDCGSATSGDIEVDVLKKPNAFIYADGPTTFCAGESVNLIANAGGGLAYQWYKGALPIPGATSISYEATTTGNYKCLVTKMASGCSRQSNPIAVAVVCRENEVNDAGQISIHPNPASISIAIAIPGSIYSSQATLTITNPSGQIISEIGMTDPVITIDVSGFAAGIYFIRVVDGNRRWVEKFVIE